MPQDSAPAIPFARPLTDDPRASCTLPARYYTDPAVFEQEKEKIFFRTWSYACHASQVRAPGSEGEHVVHHLHKMVRDALAS